MLVSRYSDGDIMAYPVGTIVGVPLNGDLSSSVFSPFETIAINTDIKNGVNISESNIIFNSEDRELVGPYCYIIFFCESHFSNKGFMTPAKFST